MNDDSDEPPRNYDVGYGKPPKNRQFQPGQSGNPSGGNRKRQGENSASLLEELIAVREGGAVRKVHAKELALRQQVKKALEEDDTATQLHLLDQFAQHGLLDVAAQDAGGGVLVLDDKSMPFAMQFILATTVGLGPWTLAQLAEARARYKAHRSEIQALIDADIGYSALRDDKECKS